MKLWNTDHPYYCAIVSRDGRVQLNSWAEFMRGWGVNDPDYNFLFRWDWEEGEDHELEPGQCLLRLSYFMQRKGYPVGVDVMVTHEDEPAIKAWLKERWQYMRTVWKGVS